MQVGRRRGKLAKPEIFAFMGFPAVRPGGIQALNLAGARTRKTNQKRPNKLNR